MKNTNDNFTQYVTLWIRTECKGCHSDQICSGFRVLFEVDSFVGVLCENESELQCFEFRIR